MPEKNPDQSTEGDDRDEMQNQVLELAQVFATPEKRAAYLKDVEAKEAQEFRQKARERKERGGDHNPVAGIFSELFGTLLASASWLIAGLVLIAAVGGGMWFVTSRHGSATTPALQPPIATPSVPVAVPTFLPTMINPSAVATAVSPAAVATAVSQLAANKPVGASNVPAGASGALAKMLAKTPTLPKSPGLGGTGSGGAGAHPASGAPGAGKSNPPGNTAGAAPPAGTANQAEANAGAAPASESVQKGAPSSPSAMAAMDAKNPDSMANLPPDLKKLWIEGADAKHRGDYAGARHAWSLALKIDPSHYGFQESIDKLPTN